MRTPLTDWDNIRRKAHNGTYLWGSVEKVTDDGGAWLNAFRAQAPHYGAEVVVALGNVYVHFPEDARDSD